MKFQINRNHKRSKRQSRGLMKIRSMKYKILLYRKNKQDVFVKKEKHQFPVHSTNIITAKNFMLRQERFVTSQGGNCEIFLFHKDCESNK